MSDSACKIGPSVSHWFHLWQVQCCGGRHALGDAQDPHPAARDATPGQCPILYYRQDEWRPIGFSYDLWLKLPEQMKVRTLLCWRQVSLYTLPGYPDGTIFFSGIWPTTGYAPSGKAVRPLASINRNIGPFLAGFSGLRCRF
jgi:hypothetical protein